MNVKSLEITDVKIIFPDSFGDHRGSLSVFYSEYDYQKMGIDFKVKQINQGFSKKQHTLRGMNFQEAPYEQAKVIYSNIGSVFGCG